MYFESIREKTWEGIPRPVWFRRGPRRSTNSDARTSISTNWRTPAAAILTRLRKVWSLCWGRVWGGIRPDISTLSDDQATAGFDTSGASLFFSSDQLEQYLATARVTLELVLRSRTPLKSRVVRVEPEEEYTPHYAVAAERMRNTSARARAFLAQQEKPASAFGILDEYQAKRQQVAEWLPLMESYLARSETKTGATLIMTIKEGGMTKVKLPVLGERAEGKYTIRVRVGAYPDAAERFHYLEFTSGFGTGRKLLGWRKVTATLEDPQII